MIPEVVVYLFMTNTYNKLVRLYCYLFIHQLNDKHMNEDKILKILFSCSGLLWKIWEILKWHSYLVYQIHIHCFRLSLRLISVIN